MESSVFLSLQVGGCLYENKSTSLYSERRNRREMIRTAAFDNRLARENLSCMDSNETAVLPLTATALSCGMQRWAK
jgi:hypothetical protein